MRFDTFQRYRKNQNVFSGLSLYDTAFARMAEQAQIEFLLVGDSLAHAYGAHQSTVSVTLEQMVYHTRAVCAGAPNTYVMADAPYLSYATVEQAIETAKQLMQAGAHVIKLECTQHDLPVLQKLTHLGVPICAHLGLTPQRVHALGGYSLQGKTPESAQMLVELAVACEAAGAVSLLLECVSPPVASDIVGAVQLPVIGIGAGNQTHGQILVANDVLGITPSPPKFAKNFLCEQGSILKAFKAYREAVQEKRFPK